jgi:hypothetical protein
VHPGNNIPQSLSAGGDSIRPEPPGSRAPSLDNITVHPNTLPADTVIAHPIEFKRHTSVSVMQPITGNRTIHPSHDTNDGHSETLNERYYIAHEEAELAQNISSGLDRIHISEDDPELALQELDEVLGEYGLPGKQYDSLKRALIQWKFNVLKQARTEAEIAVMAIDTTATVNDTMPVILQEGRDNHEGQPGSSLRESRANSASSTGANSPYARS